MTIPKPLIFILKLVLVVAALSWVFHKSNTQEIFFYLKTANLWYLLLGFLLITISHVISAFRGRFYLQSSGHPLSRPFGVALYFTGMLFNTILPGGVGGDGYKVFALGRLTPITKLCSLRLLLSDRANGMFAITILISLAIPLSSISSWYEHTTPLLFVFFSVCFLGYFMSVRMLLKEPARLATRATLYSLAIQIIGGAAVIYTLLHAIGYPINTHVELIDYIIVFYFSSIVTAIPISIGGAGLRELTFLYASSIFLIDTERGIVISLMFFGLNLLCSLLGFFTWHRLDAIHNRYKDA